MFNQASQINASAIKVEVLDWRRSMPPMDRFFQICGEELPRLNGHDERWIQAVSSGLKHRVFMLTAAVDGHQTGQLPLNLVRGPLFGKFLVSLPYLNTGGVWASDVSSANALVGAACDLADQLNVRYLELRHEKPVKHPQLNFQRTDKVHMRLALPSSEEALFATFKSKLRSQIKKASEYGFTVQFGGSECLDPFYQVFSCNMRDLGTPVFARSLFVQIIEQFRSDAEFCIVRNHGTPIACGLLVHSRGVSEVPSASSLRKYNSTGANMLLYSHLLRRSIEKGSQVFDFGRSSEGSGTYKFKAQWGAVPHPAIWQYYTRQGCPEEMRPDSGGKQRLVKIWQRLPVWLTRLIGPSIVRGIP